MQHGTISEEEARSLSEPQRIELIFQPDVSTSRVVTEISGRGVGMGILREKVEALGGRVFVETRRGAGTCFRLLLPLTLATFRGILIRCAGRLYVLPTASVERIGRVRTQQVLTMQDRSAVRLEDRAVALVRLEQVLQLPRASQKAPDPMPIVVIGKGERRVAFGVDDVLDEQEVLVKPLSRPMSRVRHVAGATVLGSGEPVPILNATDLLQSVTQRPAGSAPSPAPLPAASASPARQLTVLVVEDSITPRMLLKNILESAGYRVRTAVDGADALTKLHAEPFDLVLADVEMPRMDGFALTGRIRSDRHLADLPVVLVTGRESPEDRARGVEAGADAYLTKTGFDQANLLEVIQRLL